MSSCGRKIFRRSIKPRLPMFSVIRRARVKAKMVISGKDGNRKKQKGNYGKKRELKGGGKRDGGKCGAPDRS